jgi:hypothetical protein
MRVKKVDLGLLYAYLELTRKVQTFNFAPVSVLQFKDVVPNSPFPKGFAQQKTHFTKNHNFGKS